MSDIVKKQILSSTADYQKFPIVCDNIYESPYIESFTIKWQTLARCLHFSDNLKDCGKHDVLIFEENGVSGKITDVNNHEQKQENFDNIKRTSSWS